MTDPHPNLGGTAPRAVDHCVLPVRDLDTARARLSCLGFTVAPDGRHPFGTANCCVYFEDGTFLEPLAVAGAVEVKETARAGNVFTARDLAYRRRHGEDGFSALVFGTEDAGVDHARFTDAGISAGPMLEFTRPFIDASGKSDQASFRLAFAASERAPDCFFFTCERVQAPLVDRSALQVHGNGVTRLKGITLSAPRAADYRDFLSLVGALDVSNDRGGSIRLRAANARIDLVDDADFAGESKSGHGLRLRALLFGLPDLARFEALLRETKTAYERNGPTISVPPAPGQGACFMFEEE